MTVTDYFILLTAGLLLFLSIFLLKAGWVSSTLKTTCGALSILGWFLFLHKFAPGIGL